MIDNETPILRKEDLIDILEALFKFSQEPNNAFTRKSDGLFVYDFYEAFTNHINDNSVHADMAHMAVLDNFSIVDDILCYKGEPIIIKVSNEENNAIQVKPDGLYITDYSQHINDNIKHITEEERENWNKSLSLAKKYADDIVQALTIYDYQIVESLPVDENSINKTTVYCIKEQIPNGEEYLVRYLYREHNWIPLDITKETYKLFARKTELEDYLLKTDESVHSHLNKSVLDKLSEQDNQLFYNGNNIFDLAVSEDNDNAIFLDSDGKFYVKDLSSEIASIAKQASLSKTILLNQDCDEAGIYELEEDINEFNFLMIHYYLMPDEEELQPYDAKMEMVDVDALNELYDRHIDYILEHDYGMSTYNTKIRFFDQNKMQVTYYNHVCIYKIIGVR